jgi:hypothetical protein
MNLLLWTTLVSTSFFKKFCGLKYRKKNQKDIYRNFYFNNAFMFHYEVR